MTFEIRYQEKQITVWLQTMKLKNQENSKKNQKPEFLKVNQKIKNIEKTIYFFRNTKEPPNFWLFFEYFKILWFTLKNQFFAFFPNAGS